MLPFLAGVSFGLFLVFIHRAGGAGILWPLTTARWTSIAVLVAIGLLTRTLRLPGRSALALTALAGLLDTGGNAFFVLAARAGRLDVAGVLSSLYPRRPWCWRACSRGSGSPGVHLPASRRRGDRLRVPVEEGR